MYTCCREIIKGAQLDPDLGSCRVGIQVGLTDYHFEQEASWLVGSNGVLLRPYIHFGFSSNNSEFMMHLYIMWKSWAALSGCQCRSFQRILSSWYWSFPTEWPYYGTQYLDLGCHWESCWYLTLHRYRCSHLHGPVIPLVNHRGHEPLNIHFLMNRDSSLPPCWSCIWKVTAWQLRLKTPVLVWGITIQITC